MGTEPALYLRVCPGRRRPRGAGRCLLGSLGSLGTEPPGLTVSGGTPGPPKQVGALSSERPALAHGSLPTLKGALDTVPCSSAGPSGLRGRAGGAPAPSSRGARFSSGMFSASLRSLPRDRPAPSSLGRDSEERALRFRLDSVSTPYSRHPRGPPAGPPRNKPTSGRPRDPPRGPAGSALSPQAAGGRPRPRAPRARPPGERSRLEAPATSDSTFPTSLTCDPDWAPPREPPAVSRGRGRGRGYGKRPVTRLWSPPHPHLAETEEREGHVGRNESVLGLLHVPKAAWSWSPRTREAVEFSAGDAGPLRGRTVHAIPCRPPPRPWPRVRGRESTGSGPDTGTGTGVPEGRGGGQHFVVSWTGAEPREGPASVRAARGTHPSEASSS